ncbi:RNA-binding protein [Candidatus Poribacteria bacterium]|nr:RNA-binding protein [Candidatus Poribacteria bacterium]
MCQSNVYALEGDREELLLEDVSLIETQNGSVTMCTLFGEPMAVEGRIVGIDLVRQKVYLERTATAD